MSSYAGPNDWPVITGGLAFRVPPIDTPAG